MSHNHNHSHEAGSSTKNIFIAFTLNISFAIFEIIGGLITGSTAILSDAVHDFGDSLALGLSLIFQKFSDKAPTAKYSYGFKRLPVIGAIINIVVLSLGTIFVFTEAMERFANPQTVMAEGMFFMSIVGIVINGISVLRMKGSQKILDKTVLMHLCEDLLGWVAVFAVSIVMYFTNWYILDPILSLIICAIILKNIITNVKITADIILGATLDMETREHIRKHITELSQDILAIGNMNLWSLDGEENVLSIQVLTKPQSDTEAIRRGIKSIIEEEGIHFSTVEIAQNGGKF